ncbi:hypothetical protein JCM8547_007843 [Rhodosporidiobolus lusitaniae]
MAILLPARLHSLLSLLVSPSGDGCPHSALLLAIQSGGDVVCSVSTPTTFPYPRAALDDLDDEGRAGAYAALAVGSWEDHRQAGGKQDKGEPVMLETELGRIALVALGSFLLVLVGNETAPWKVLDKKIRAATDKLKEPLEKVAA